MDIDIDRNIMYVCMYKFMFVSMYVFQNRNTVWSKTINYSSKLELVGISRSTRAPTAADVFTRSPSLYQK